jgi:hypothetical protein
VKLNEPKRIENKSENLCNSHYRQSTQQQLFHTQQKQVSPIVTVVDGSDDVGSVVCETLDVVD